jgi:hypothetical protein|tara:strand:+ start:216 stop:554 length:339 start_codon:yes stop_codon:yes gene_type:complete
MTKQEFQETRKYILEKAQDIMDAKQPEYTNKSIDVLYNFISTAKSIGIEPMEVWAVFFNKHVQAILSHAGDPNMKQAEPIESRYADAINYLFLGFALLIQDDNKKDIISGTE